MAKYRKIDPRIWNDKKFYSASLSCQHLFLFILTHPQMTPVGAMRTTLAGLREELEWDDKKFPEAFPEALADAIQCGFIEYDKKAKFLRVCNFLNYNKPESINVLKSWRGCWDDLPECELKIKVFQSLYAMAYGISDAFGDAMREAFPEGIAYTGTGTGTGKGTGKGVSQNHSVSSENEFSSETAHREKNSPSAHLKNLGVEFLVECGLTKRRAHGLIGRLRKAVNDTRACEIVEAAKGKSDPVAYIEKAMKQPAKLPKDDAKLPEFAKVHELSPPGSLTSTQYRQKLQREIEAAHA